MQDAEKKTLPDAGGTTARAADSLAGKLLLASPFMQDTRFASKVIFVCAHDSGGAMGLVINAAMPHVSLSALLEQLDVPFDGSDVTDLPVLQGGPVESGRGFLLHSTDVVKPDTVLVDSQYAVTGTLEALKDIVSGTGPRNRLFVLGYAGWAAGQLEAELAENAWLVAEADPEIVFHEAFDRKWQSAMRKAGIDPRLLLDHAGHA